MPQSASRVEVRTIQPVHNNDAAIYSKLVEKVRTARSKVDSDIAFNKIVTWLDPRIKNLCRKFNISGLDQFDIYQESLVALRFKAIKDYDKTRGTTDGPAPFDRFALLCIRRHLATELKTSHQIRRKVWNGYVSLDQERNDSNDELSLINILPSKSGEVLGILERKEYHTKLVTKLLSKLSKFETEVFMLYIEKYTYEEIAEIINKRRLKARVNIKGVDNALSRIKNKAEVIFLKYGDKDLRTRTAKSIDNAIARVKRKADSIKKESDLHDSE